MRVIRFDGTREEDRVVWAGLYMAFYFTSEQGTPLVPIFTTIEREKDGRTLEELFEKTGQKAGGGLERELRPEAEPVEIRESAFDLLKEFWTAFRRLQPPGRRPTVTMIDAFLQDVPQPGESPAVAGS